MALVGPDGLEPYEPFGVTKGETNQGSIDRLVGTNDGHEGDDDDVVLLLVLGVTGKLDMGKSGLIFKVLASAFSCRRHFARRF